MAASELVSPLTMGPRVGDYRAPITDRPLRIVYVWDADYPWDVRVEKICATLTSAGHDVHIVARNRGWRSTEERLPEATVHRMPPWRAVGQRVDGALGFPAFFSPRWRALLDGVVRRVRPDVIIARDIPLAPTAIWSARRHGIPVVLDVAENYPAMMRMIYEARRQRLVDHVVRNPAAAAAVERYCLFRADRIIVVVDEMAERMRRMGVSADRIDVISNTPPRSRAELAPARGSRRPGAPLELVYLGLLEIPRGVKELLDAVALLRDEGCPVQLTVVGTGRDAALFQEQADRLRLGPPMVRFLGYVDRETALAAVEHADIGVLPHHRNEQWNTSMPNKLFDYMAVGLPVVTSDAIPCVRITHESGAGEVFEAGNATSLAAAIRRMQSDEARARYGAAGRCAVLERYNWECEAPNLLQSIARAVPAPAGPA
jgi:glycosyltransferase involved in cell wall biosynthesis